MVAMGRALMMEPSVLLLDEPSAGLSPVMQDEVFVQTRRINRPACPWSWSSRTPAAACRSATVPTCSTRAATPTPAPAQELAKDPKVIELYLGTLAKRTDRVAPRVALGTPARDTKRARTGRSGPCRSCCVDHSTTPVT